MTRCFEPRLDWSWTHKRPARTLQLMYRIKSMILLKRSYRAPEAFSPSPQPFAWYYLSVVTATSIGPSSVRLVDNDTCEIDIKSPLHPAT